MSWYRKIKISQEENQGLWGQQVPGDQNPSVPQQPEQQYSGSLKDDLFDFVHSEQDLYKLLNHYHIQYEKIVFNTGAEPVVVLYQGKQIFVVDSFDQPLLKEGNEWVYSVNPEIYISKPDFNIEFWGGIGDSFKVYHGTTEENVPEILKNGLEPRNQTRGLGNRGTGSAVFTSTERETALYYYDKILEIDVSAMKKGGYTPDVSLEEPVAEAEMIDALAHKIGLEDFHQDMEDGLDPGTIIFYGPIGPQYIRLVS